MMRTAIAKKVTLIGAAAFMASIGTPVATYASVKGTKNTAIAVTAGSLYSLLRGHTRTGIVLGAGSVYAWKKYHQSKKKHAARSYYYTHRR